MSKKFSKGFTLVELSIVLIIIGLIIGGVLVGQDLIKSAEISATVRQISGLNASVSAFRVRYNGLPGDLSSVTAQSFGLLDRTGGLGLGDGNGLIEPVGGGFASVASGETVLFWNDLQRAGLLEGNLTALTDATAAGGITTTGVNTADQFFLPAKLGKGNYFTVYAVNGVNFYEIVGITQVVGGNFTLYNGIAPADAFNIDSKLDDGLPNSGIVSATGDTALNGAASTAAVAAGAGATTNVCVNTTINPPQYNNANTGQQCRIRIRMG